MQCNCEISQKVYRYIALLHSLEVLYIEPNDGPDGSKYVAYMKVHGCLRYPLFIY